jgi:hypothetical protein
MVTIGSTPIFAPSIIYGQRVIGHGISAKTDVEKILAVLCRQIFTQRSLVGKADA